MTAYQKRYMIHTRKCQSLELNQDVYLARADPSMHCVHPRRKQNKLCTSIDREFPQIDVEGNLIATKNRIGPQSISISAPT